MKTTSYSPEMLSNMLLWTPWDDRLNSEQEKDIRSALQREKHRFYRECFVPLQTRSTEENMWKKLSNLLDAVSRQTIIITSFAGVGKSTMLHAMLEHKKMQKTSIVLDLLKEVDLHPDGGWSQWLADYCDDKPEKLGKPMHNKLIKLLVIKIYDLLFLSTVHNQDNGINKNNAPRYLKRFQDAMQTYFRGLEGRFVTLNNIITNFIEDTIPYDEFIDNDEPYSQQIARALFELFKNETNPTNMVRDLLEFMSVLAICNMDNPTMDRICIAFDNVEHYIDNRIVRDKEIIDFLSLINGRDGDGFIASQNTKYHNRYSKLGQYDERDMIYSSRIRLVLVVREFTANTLPGMADAISRVGDHTIKLHNQISLQEIVRHRVKFIRQVINTDLYELEPMATIANIFKDKVLAENISRMFSYNKRKSIRNLIDACYRELPSGATCIRDEILKSYGTLTKGHESSNMKRIYSHGRRQLIFSALYDSMLDNLRSSSTRLGTALKPGGVQKIGEELKLDNFISERGSVRQIMVYLARRKFDNTTVQGREPMVKFSDIIKAIFLKPNLMDNPTALHQFPDNFPEELEQLAKNLNILRSRDHLARLSPLILLRFEKPGKIDETHIKEVLENICKNKESEYKDGVLRYGVQCTIAGRMFAQYCASFEFIAARHFNSILEKSNANPLCSPLFSLELHNTDKIVEYIEEVKEITLCNCIGTMIEKIKSFLSVEGLVQYNHLYTGKLVHEIYDFNDNKHTGIEVTHAERIIIQHIRYIDDYRLYAVEKLLRNVKTSEKTANVEEFSKKLLAIIEAYIEKLCALTEECISGENQFLLGGPERKAEDDWGSRSEFGYKKYKQRLELARQKSLHCISVAPGQRESAYEFDYENV